MTEEPKPAGPGGSADPTPDPTPDPTIAAVARAIVASGAGIAVLGLVLSTRRVFFAGSVVVGTAIAVVNFLVLAGVGRAMTSPGGRGAWWSLVYPLKIAGLFGGLFFLLRSGWVDVLGTLCGLSSLVPGIVLGGVAASHRGP